MKLEWLKVGQWHRVSEAGEGTQEKPLPSLQVYR